MARLEEEGVGQTTLRVQYRMPPELLEHPSSYFYGSLVVCAPGGECTGLRTRAAVIACPF